MSYKIFLFVLIPFVLIACFIPERRIYFSWDKPKDIESECNYDFVLSTNMSIIQTERGYLLNTDREIYYKVGAKKAYNIEDYTYVMNEMISFMSNNRNAILIVEGHADEISKEKLDLNMRLSLQRASVIRDVILSFGVYHTRVKIYPYSYFAPKYTTNTSKNRRVDFVALKCENQLSNYNYYYSNYYSNYYINNTNFKK
ncbi:OmpA family protein [Brachyspira pilosicoli]|uniref:OmpA family protein n=1 Tax=Brachyspira pilosicoli TaxID=52584 RepID=UPI003007F021